MTIAPSYKQTFGLDLRPALAWVAILGFASFTGLLILAGAGKILNFAFPGGAFVVGILLYTRAPILFVGFSWWICLLTPLIRRLADYRSGFTDPSPILLAPYLVVLITLVTLWKNLPKAYSRAGFPFILSIAGVVYGILIGLISNPPLKVGIAALEWLAPVLFGFHLFENWRSYPSYRQNIQRTLTWGVLIMGSYGVIQYLFAPEWDRFWLINIDLNTMGKPEPLGMRVWSTLHSPEPFAAIMAGSLLLLFNSKSVILLPASIVGYLSFLLSSVRAGWLGWAVGLLGLATTLKTRFQLRLIITLILITVCVVPLTSVEPFSQIINERLQTLSDIENDTSANDRKNTYQALLGSALTNVVGDGISGKRLDSAVLSMLIELGWLGTLFYAGGMLIIILSLFQHPSTKRDPFVGTSKAIVLSALIRFPFNIPMLGPSGFLFWGFLGIGMAGLMYHLQQPEN